MARRFIRCFFVPGACGLLFAAGLDPAARAASPATDQKAPLQIAIDLQQQGGVISPLLFGHNLEHTRHAVWRGLSAQMIANRKFSGPAGPGGLALHWLGIGIEGVEFSLDTKEPFARAQSQRISILKAGVAGGIAQNELHLNAGTTYEVRLWLKADRQQRLIVRLCDVLDQRIYFQHTAPVTPGEWQQLEFTFKAPRTDDSARFEIIGQDAGTFLVGAVSLLPADHFHGMRRDVVERLKEMSVPLLRWPGGNYTRDYRWEQGLLPVDRRPPIRAAASTTLPFTESYDFHEIGTDEFFALCQELKSVPSLTINMADAPPEEAAGWVQYCNGSADTKWGKVRASRGHPEPYRVKYWSVGNEIYADWMGPAHTDAVTYARRIEKYAQVMKEADPSIVLIASGAAGAPVAEEGWDTKVVSGAGQYFDHIAEHHYAKTKGDAPEELARLAKIPTTELVTKWRNARRTIDAASPGGKSIGIAFDEWNIWHPWFAAPYQNEWHIGSRDGVYVASLLNMLCRESGSLGISMAAYFQPINEGAIAVTPFAAKLTPIGQVFGLYRAHHGNRLIKLADQAGDFDVDVCAGHRADGSIAVTLVNRNPVSARSVELILPQTVAGDGGSATFLTADGLGPDDGMTQRVERINTGGGQSVPLALPPFSVVLWESRRGK